MVRRSTSIAQSPRARNLASAPAVNAFVAAGGGVGARLAGWLSARRIAALCALRWAREVRSDEGDAVTWRGAAAGEPREALTASLRAAMGARDAEAAACLGTLGRLYAAQGRGPDGFFRACASVLGSVDRRDLDALQLVLGRGVALLAEARPDCEGEATVSIGEVELRRDGGEITAAGVSIRVTSRATRGARQEVVKLRDVGRVRAHLAHALSGGGDLQAGVVGDDLVRLAIVLGVRSPVRGSGRY
jgi:hypothetical protein